MTWVIVLGIFAGNLLWHGLKNHDWKRGFWVGIIAAVICTVFIAVRRF
jgi:hypothetical protein